MENKKILIISIIFIALISCFILLNKITKPNSELLNTSSTTTTILKDTANNKEFTDFWDDYDWPKSKFNILNTPKTITTESLDIKGQPPGEPPIYYEKETLNGIEYETLTGWVKKDTIKINNGQLLFSVYNGRFESKSELKFSNINTNIIKILKNNKEYNFEGLSSLPQTKIVNVKIYLEIPKATAKSSYFTLLLPIALAKISPDANEYQYNPEYPISLGDTILPESPILKHRIYKIIFQEPIFEQRILKGARGDIAADFDGEYLFDRDKDAKLFIKFANSQDWINIAWGDESPYWALENLLDYASKNETYIEFYCSKFNNSSLIIHTKTVWEFNFNFQENEDIKIPIQYTSSEPQQYKWVSDKTIMFNDEHYNDQLIDISKFIADNPKLQRNNNEEWTEKGILSFTGAINCGKLKNLDFDSQCFIEATTLSFK